MHGDSIVNEETKYEYIMNYQTGEIMEYDCNIGML